MMERIDVFPLPDLPISSTFLFIRELMVIAQNEKLGCMCWVAGLGD
jgi:hypothetical protein